MAVLASCSKVVLTHSLDVLDPSENFTPHKGNVNCVVWNHNSNIKIDT